MNNEERKLRRKQWDEKYRRTHREEIRKRANQNYDSEKRKSQYQEHKTECLKTMKIYAENHKDAIRKYIADYRRTRYKNDPEWKERLDKISRESAKRRYQKIVVEIKTILGNKCANSNCPIPRDKLDPRALQIDHIHGHGNKQRKAYMNKSNHSISSYNYYRDVLKEIKFGSKEYQLLCAYCNWLKRYENREIKNLGKT